MDSIRRYTTVVCLALAACGRAPDTQGARPVQVARGTAYSIDTIVLTQAPENPSRRDAASGSYRAFQTFSARVVYARGRGRFDVLSMRAGPLVRVDSAALTTPIGRPGDYYLFDSTGFVLVRPATRTFSSATITHDAYGHYEYREGWPEFFEFQPPHLDTITDAAAPSNDPHGPLNVYWHTDSGTIGFARGRIAIDDVPLRELNVVRWFGATRWLAHTADSARVLPRELTVTVGVPFRPSAEPGVPRSYILRQAFLNPAMEDIDVSLLVLPAGFSETGWQGGVPSATPPRSSTDGGARWRTVPRGSE